MSHALARARQAAGWAHQAGDPPTRYLALAQAACCCGASNDLPALRQALADLAGLKDPAWAPFIDGDASDHERWFYGLTGDHQGALDALHSQARRSRAAGLGDAIQISSTVPVLMALRRVDEAIALARQLASKAAQARKRGMMRHHLNHLVRACLAKQGTPTEVAEARAEAREAARDFWPLALLHDMQPRWADGVALLAALAQQLIARADQLARAVLVATHDEKAIERWLAEGAALNEAALPALAFDAKD